MRLFVLVSAPALILAAASCATVVETAPGAGGTTSSGVTTSGGQGGVGGCLSDTACDDADPCTADACYAGICEHTPVPVGTACGAAGAAGQCNAQGICEAGDCGFSVCPEPADPCSVAGCDPNTAACIVEPLPDGTLVPGPKQIAGDCRVQVCQGGISMTMIDDVDVPADPTPCTESACSNGVAVTYPRPAGTPCPAGICDGVGACVP
jgi:hypothetical protein